MALPIPVISGKHRRGNPNWGKPCSVPTLPTEFELQVRQLGLTTPEYVASAALRICQRNRNRVYVPEWLLEAWEMPVDITFTLAS